LHAVFVDGPAGAGKTTWADGLSAGLGVPVVHMDDLYLGWSGLEGAFYRLEELVLAPLSAGQTAAFKAYDWTMDSKTAGADPAQQPPPKPANLVLFGESSGLSGPGLAAKAGQSSGSTPGAFRVIEPCEWLVVEGCGCAPRAAQRWIDTLVWLDGPWPLRRTAVVERDGAASEPEIDRWELATQQHFEREQTRQRADLKLERGGRQP